MHTKITTIPIFPVTNVRSTQGDRWLFKVDDEKLEEYDQKKFDETGKMGGNVRRKRQLEKYNAYKEEIRYYAVKNNFKMPHGYFAIWFYIPSPKSWRKKKRREMEGKPHTSTPDLDNLLKAFFDSIMPRRNRLAGDKGADDRKIHCYTAFKMWVPEGQEGIDIVEYDPEVYMDKFSYSRPVPTTIS